METEFMLRHPNEQDGVSVSGLLLRRPTVDDLTAAFETRRSASDVATRRALLVLISGVAEVVIGRIDAADWIRLQAVIDAMMND